MAPRGDERPPRRGAQRLITAADAGRFVHLVRSLPIVVDPAARVRVFESTVALARTHGLTTYDAAYLELAVRLGVPLVTLDGELRTAAEAEGVKAGVA